MTDLIKTWGDVAVQAKLEGTYSNRSISQKKRLNVVIGEPGCFGKGQLKV